MKMPQPDQLHILIVDDMENMRRSIRAMLKLVHYGRRFFEASNGQEAWDILKTEEDPIHLIISDWNMPKITGTELLNRIRTDRRFRNIPFLMITAEANKEIVAEAAENEVDAYLTKPFVTASLEKKIAELLHNAEHPDPLTILLDTLRELDEAGKLTEAIQVAQKAVEINERSSRPLRELGRLYLKQNDLDAAKTQFERAISINQLDVSSFHYLGQIAYHQEDIEAAIEYFARAMDISPRHADRAIKFANLLLRKKKIRQAEKIFSIVLKNNLANFDLKEEIAERCLEGGLYSLAVRIYREILRYDQNRTYLNRKIGQALLQDNSPKEAILYLENALEKSPEDLSLMLHLSQAYLDIHKPVPAEKWAVRVIRQDPDNTRARKILDRLDK